MEADYPILEFDDDEQTVIKPHMLRERLDVPVAAVPCFFRDAWSRLSISAGT